MKSNWKAFSEMAQTFLAKAEACSKASEAQAFFELAERSSTHALVLWQELVSDSVSLFLQAYGIDTWRVYSDFCSRNGLESLSEVDFDLVMAEMRERKPVAAANSSVGISD